MKSLWNVKEPLPFDQTVFDKMKNTAAQTVQRAQNQEYAQALVIVTTTGKEYSSFIENAVSADKADEKAFIDRLVKENDTEIDRILCLWQDGEVDVPSYDFRNMLCQLNSANLNAGVFVMTKDGWSVIELKATMK